MPEATPEFKQWLREAFDEMYVGQTLTFRRTFIDGDVALFCGVIGDYNPYHQDASFAREPLRAIDDPGPPYGEHADTYRGYARLSGNRGKLRVPIPVYVGDTITCTVTVMEKDEAKRRVYATAGFVVNQDGVEVLWARFSSFPSRIRLAR